jgi:hypothetical protein
MSLKVSSAWRRQHMLKRKAAGEWVKLPADRRARKRGEVTQPL